jgi:hypothetical protein
VALPSSHQLGLENFTIHPTTPPLKFRPVKITNGNYALQIEGSYDGQTETPYLAALQSSGGTRTASMAIIRVSKPSCLSHKAANSPCMKGLSCTIDKWTFDASMDTVYPRLRFAGFEGSWEPFKDAGKEGWHVYWKGEAGLSHPIQLDLVPMSNHKD